MSPASSSKVALLLVAHGERREAADNRTLQQHADALRARTGVELVLCGVLKGEPSLEGALYRAAEHGIELLIVYPFLMSNGYFVSRVLPARLAASGYRGELSIVPPLGLEPGLVPLMMARAVAAAREAVFNPSRTHLLVVGHGSRFGSESARATEAVAVELARNAVFEAVSTAFLEEPPMLRGVLAGGRERTVVIGFFSGEGLHAWIDVPAAIEETGANAVYAGPIGADPGIPDLILASLQRRASGDRSSPRPTAKNE